MGGSLGSMSTDALGASSRSFFDAGARSAAALGSFIPAFGTSSSSSVLSRRTGNASDASGSAPAAGTEPGAPYHGAAAPGQRDRTKEALNCCRILTRILPIIMEGDHDESCNVQADGGVDQIAALSSHHFEDRVLWTPINDTSFFASQDDDVARGPRESPRTLQEDEQFVIAESDDEDEGRSQSVTESVVAKDPLQSDAGRQSGRASGSDQQPVQLPPPLGERLTKTVIDMLFYSGFTLPWTEEQLALPEQTTVVSSRVQYTIWEKGIGSTVDLPGKSTTHEACRVEVLRLLVALLSNTIYIPAHAQQTSDNRPLRHVTTRLDRSVVLPLLCSLLNVSVARVKDEGWFTGLTQLPAGLVKDRLTSGLSAEDPRQATVTLAFQLLNVLLGYQPPQTQDEGERGQTESEPQAQYAIETREQGRSAKRPDFLSTASSQSIKTAAWSRFQNSFQIYLGKLHRQSDFHLLADGVFAVLAQRSSPIAFLGPAATSNYAVDTSGAGPNVPDALLLLWSLLRDNAKFRTYVLDGRSPQLLSHMLFHALNNKDNIARQGIVRLVSFMLQDISCDRAFAVNICKAGSGVKARISGAHRWGIAAIGGAVPTNVVEAATGAAGKSSQAATAADVLIQGVYALIATTKSTLSALYAPLVITLTNLSPYCRNLSILSANRLITLFRSFTSPAFLLADEGNPRLVYYLTECLNNIVTYGFQKNANFVYALVRNHFLVERLANFTLRKGIAEIRRAHRRAGVAPIEESSLTTPRSDSVTEETMQSNAESEKDATADTNGEVLSNTLAQDSDQPSSEKARGKMRRSSTSSDAVQVSPRDDRNRPRAGNRGTHSNEDEDEENRLVNGFSEEELVYAASTIGRNGFVPSQSWVTSWHKGLPLDTLQLAVLELVPKVQDLCTNIGSRSDADERILAYLREQSLEGVLPAAPPTVQPRAFRWTPQVSIWLLSYVWGLIYVSHEGAFLRDTQSPRLFTVQH